MLVDPVVDLEVEGLVQVAVGLGGNERAVLRSKVGSGHEHRRDLVAHHLANLLQVLEADLALAFEDLVDVIAAHRGADVPLFDVADSLGVLQPGGGDQRDVAERGAAEVRQDGFVRLGVKPLRFPAEVLQIRVGDRPELLQVIFDVQLRSSMGSCRGMLSK